MRAIENIIADIERFDPVRSSWLDLDGSVNELFSTDKAADGMGALFRVFERNPLADGYGVFWTLLHGLESLPEYEHSLLESTHRCPSAFTLIMLKRLSTAGVREIAGISIVGLLNNIAENPAVPAELRRQARRYSD